MLYELILINEIEHRAKIIFWVYMVLATGSVLGSWQSSYNLRHLYVEQQLFFSDPQSSLPWGAMLNFQYEKMRAITPNLKHLLPIHTWDLVTLTSHMTPRRENG